MYYEYFQERYIKDLKVVDLKYVEVPIDDVIEPIEESPIFIEEDVSEIQLG